MTVYRPQERVVETADLLRTVRESMTGATLPPEDLLIHFGELEAGVVDADAAATPVFRRAAMALGRLYLRGSVEEGQRFRAAFDEVERLALPRRISVSVPEGYAFYALYPEMYIEAARRFAAECQPRDVCVIAIRSIGTSLSAVVAATLEEAGCRVHSYTVRPHGHPFDRQVDLPPDMARDAQYYAIVDEGPGLSGSSFVSVADHFAPERVVLFPSWEGAADRFVNDRARALWPRLRRYCASFKPPSISGEDISAGKWREMLGMEVAVQPQHEARKYLDGSTLYKFAGLGSYGRSRFDRACVLADAGWSPRARRIDRGFIAFDFVPGRVGGRVPIKRMAEYLAFRAAKFPAARSLDFDWMQQLIGAVDFSELRSEFEDRPAVAVDGRMMPHEWIDTAQGWLKTDSVDHCCDHFLPGYADIAWDLAGAAVEFQMTDDERAALLGEYRVRTRGSVSEGLLHFYELAYLSFRAAYAKLAGESTASTIDGKRFKQLYWRYQWQLETALERHRVMA